MRELHVSCTRPWLHARCQPQEMIEAERVAAGGVRIEHVTLSSVVVGDAIRYSSITALLLPDRPEPQESVT